MMEDSIDYLIYEIEKFDSITQGDLLSIQSRIYDLERMVGTILKGYGGNWGKETIDILLRLAKRRGWPLENELVRKRITKVATNIAEYKGAIFIDGIKNMKLGDTESTIKRLRKKLSERAN